MIYEIEGRVVLTLEHKPGTKSSAHIRTDFNLDVDKQLDKKQYLDVKDLPTVMGTKALTLAFVHGLIGNIHHAQEKGYWNDAEHLRYIIAELERGFASVHTVKIGKF